MRNTARTIGNGRGQMPPAAYRFCVHSANGGPGTARMCILDYQCEHCAFDQWLEEIRARESVAKTFRASGLAYTLARAA